MNPGSRGVHLIVRSPDDFAQLIRSIEGVEQNERAAQLEGGMRIRADRAHEVMLLRKSHGAAIEDRQHTARVKNLNRIHERKNFQQVRFLPTAAAPLIEGMRDTDEGVLLPQAKDRFLRRELGRNFLGHEGGQDFPTRRHYFLANDHTLRVHSLRGARTGNRVVICDDEAVNSFAAAGLNQFLRRSQ